MGNRTNVLVLGGRGRRCLGWRISSAKGWARMGHSRRWHNQRSRSERSVVGCSEEAPGSITCQWTKGVFNSRRMNHRKRNEFRAYCEVYERLHARPGHSSQVRRRGTEQGKSDEMLYSGTSTEWVCPHAWRIETMLLAGSLVRQANVLLLAPASGHAFRIGLLEWD